MKKIIFALLIFMPFAVYAFNGNDQGNGGDLCELRFQNVRDDIAHWIIQDGGNGLELPMGLDKETYKLKMLSQVSEAVVSCVDASITLGSSEKTCKNFVDQNGRSKIQCNVKRFMSSIDSEQYILVHHEYAGLAGFEKNESENSQYEISKQISGFLETENVKKLVIRPNISRCLGSTTREDALILAIKSNDIACVRQLAPLVDLNKPIDNGEYVPGTNWGNRLAPLGYASRLGHTDIVELLINLGSYVHYESPMGGSALRIASFVGQPDVIKVLIKYGAYLNSTTCDYGTYRRDCETALVTALLNPLKPTETQRFQTIETLLSLGANPNPFSGQNSPLSYALLDFKLVDLLLKYGAQPNGKNRDTGRSAIFYCYDSHPCYEKLVFRGADINSEDFNSCTVLDYSTGGGREKIITQLGGRKGAFCKKQP